MVVLLGIGQAGAVIKSYSGLDVDRVLLLNNDSTNKVWGAVPPYAVTCQGYYDTNQNAAAYWVHDNTATSWSTTKYLKGTHHEYFFHDGTPLWVVNQARVGCAYTTVAGRNYLPWSSKDSVPLYGNVTNGTVMLRNTTDAYILSPYYSDGIGTIYFDAVNASTAWGQDYLYLEIATNTLAGTSLVASNAMDDADWQLLPFDVLAVIGNTSAPLQSAVTNVYLASTAGGSGYFYRIRARLNCYQGVRFRIRRSVADPSVGLEAAPLLLVDDVIASYPPASGELSQFGSYDPSRAGTAVLGYANAFSCAFPAVDQSDAYARAKLSFLTNAGSSKETAISNMQLHYRWRYLDQLTNAWSTLTMVDSGGGNDATQLIMSSSAVDLTAGAGDLEYYFTASVDGPYYIPHDYSGTGAGFGSDWSEQVTAITNRASFSIPTPAHGYDYFIRLREGYSPYESVQLVTTTTDSNAVMSVTEMELVGSRRWRAFIKTDTNSVGSVKFHFLGVNRTEDGADHLNVNSQAWCSTVTNLVAKDVPYSGLAGPVGDGEDATLAVDAATGYLMFEFNDETLSYAITHADYQNFNLWTDAVGSFSGDSTETSGVSSVKLEYDETFTNAPSSVASSTNVYWTENFNLQQGQSASTYPYYKFFPSKLTPNGWTAEQIMFVGKTYLTNGIALQMEGRGKGSVAFSNSEHPLTGFGAFDFTARLAQFLDFTDFAYYIGDDAMGLHDYGISAKVAMSTTGGADLSPGTPSVSMVGYYRPQQGCYEFRVTRISTNQVQLSLLKWVSDGSTMTTNMLTNVISSVKATDAGFFTNMLVSASALRLSVMYLSVTTNSSATVIKGGLSRATASENEFTLTDFGGAIELSYRDTSSSRLTRGTYGVGTTDCLGDIAEIRKNKLVGGDIDLALTTSTSEKANLINKNWAIPIGRNDVFADDDYMGYGIKGIATPQPLKVYTSTTSGSINWVDTGLTLYVSNFTNKGFTFAPETTDNYYVRLAHGGESTDPRTDVVVDNLKITAWRGALGWDGATGDRVASESAFGYNGMSNEWVWTEAWIDEVGPTNKYGVHTTLVCSLQPKRAKPDMPLSLRTPYLCGMGLFTFSYTNASPDAVLKLQIATNDVRGSTLPTYTEAIDGDHDYWTDVTNITFTGAATNHGTVTFYFGLRAPVSGVLRLMMDPLVVSNAQASADASAGRITITGAICYDEPALDNRSWWGWNIMTTTNSAFCYLPDPSLTPPGLSGALNNSLTNGLKDANNWQDYKWHNPFVQSPLASNGIGQVSFRARKFDRNAATPSAVTVYGSKTDGSAPDTGWTVLTNIIVTSPSYRLYSWAAEGDSSDIRAVRLCVRGVKAGDTQYAVTNPVQRVLLEEIVAAEPVAPRLGFTLVRPFRSQLISESIVTNLASCDEQPLAGETFGIQAEMHLQQLANEIDLSSVKVYLAYYTGTSPWGYENWKNNPAAVTAELQPTESNLVYRSSYKVSESIIPPQNNGEAGTVVQYYVWATYRKIGADASSKAITHGLSSSEWSTPDWYWPLDYNTTYGGSTGAFAGYTILDSVSPHRVWINEVNYYDGLVQAYDQPGDTNQFIEIAVPAGVDITGWCLQATSISGETQPLCYYGQYGVAGSKTEHATNRYAFISVRSPATVKAKGAADGTWSTTFPDVTSNGKLSYWEPYALEVIRSSGIVEHQIIVGGTNVWISFEMYSPSNLLTNLLRSTPDAKWFYVGDDKDAGTLGVMKNYGLVLSDWESSLKPTSGLVNQRADNTLQQIDPNYYLPPNGTNIWIYATIGTAHLLQVTSAGNTNTSAIIIMPAGSSTNITYLAEPWFRVGSLTTNGTTVASALGQQAYTLALNDIQSSMDVVAGAVVSPALTNLGIDASNPYTDSVINWIQGYKEGPIALAGYYSPGGIFQRYLTLTEMYWLDINPVESNRLYAGIVDGPTPISHTNDVSGSPYVVTNFRLTAYMMITNTIKGGTAFPPAMIQGLNNASSTNYVMEQADSVWTSVTFKVQGALSTRAPNTWIPLRWFVFHPDSFGAANSANPFRAQIEIWDPFDVGSSAYSSGWHAYRGESLNFNWSIDSVLRPVTIEVLQTNSVWESDIVP